jgi:hypothetical protein
MSTLYGRGVFGKSGLGQYLLYGRGVIGKNGCGQDLHMKVE